MADFGSAVALVTEPAVLVAGGVAVVVAGLGGWLTEIGAWYRNLRFPWWKPPNWLFGPAWTVIFVLVVASAVQAWWAAPDAGTKRWLVLLFGVNAVLNVAWSALFFRMRRPDWAAIEVVALWVSIGALVLATGQVSGAAAWCLAPYWAWVSFAAVLNWAVVRLNPAFA
jgi:benzodiazapine receptor